MLPKFKASTRASDAKLPLPTRMLLGFTDFMSALVVADPGVVVALVLVAVRVLGGERGKARRDALLLRLPAIGPLVQLAAIERFCRVLAALVHTGVPLPDAVQVSADSTNNRVFQTKLATVREAMMRGEGSPGRSPRRACSRRRPAR